MAKKTTTTQSLGARGQANLGIVAAAGQRFAPTKLDISGYIKALGNVAEVLVAREEAALEREEAISLSSEIMNDDLFTETLKKQRDNAIDNIDVMRKSLPFTKKYKEAKKQVENTKKLIENFKPAFNILDQKNADLNGIVTENENGDLEVNISNVNDPDLENYLLAFYSGKFGEKYDVDGEGPIEPKPWYNPEALEKGVIEILNVKGDYVSPKDLNFKYVVKGAGDNIANAFTNTVKSTRSDRYGDNTYKGKLDKINSQYAKNVNEDLNEYRNMYNKNPKAFNDFLMNNSYIIDGDKPAISFINYYITNIATTGEGANEDIIKQAENLKNTADTAAKKKALDLLFLAISKNDANYIDDVMDYLKQAMFVNFDK
tara:strand:+ start:669 stop:1787 length:1119 start_codon:yes stop_codon:yes gene_type:complete